MLSAISDNTLPTTLKGTSATWIAVDTAVVVKLATAQLDKENIMKIKKKDFILYP